MRRGRIFIFIALLLIVGVVVAFFVLRPILTPPTIPDDGTTPVVSEEVDTVTVLMTTQKIRRGMVVTADVVMEHSIPRENFLDGMLESADELTGQRARFDLEPQIFLTDGMLVDMEGQLSSVGSDHALLIPKGMVAVSIPISRLSSVSYGLRRGDHVNVIVTLLYVDMDANFQSALPNNTAAILAPGPALLMSAEAATLGATTGEEGLAASLSVDEMVRTLTVQSVSGGLLSPSGRLELDQSLGQPFYVVPSEPQRPRLTSQSLLQDVVVLQIGDFALASQEPTPTIDSAATDEGDETAEAADAASADGEAAQAAPVTPDVITLVVSPQAAVALNYLLYSGAELSLALRSAQDDSQPQIEAVTLQFLLDQYLISLPAKLPYSIEPRLDVLTPPVLSNDIPAQPEE